MSSTVFSVLSPRSLLVIFLGCLFTKTGFCAKLTDFKLNTGRPFSGDSEEEVLLSLIKRTKRHGDSQDDGYTLKLRAFSTDYEGKMVRPARSIFSPNFQYFVVGDEVENRMTARKATPSPEEMKQIEEGHYVSSLLNGAFSLQEENGFRTIRGTIGDISIHSVDNSSSKAARGKEKFEILTDLINKINVLVTKKFTQDPQKDDESEPQPSTNDYLDSGQKIIPAKKKRKLGGAVNVEPEVLVIIDNKKFSEFNGVTKDILDYMGVFFHAVNNLYSSFNDPKITFRIAAITSMSTTGAQPFIESSRTSDGIYELEKILSSFASWVFTNKETLPKHDLAALITGIDVHGASSGKSLNKNIAGLAYLGSACYVDPVRSKSLSTSASEDLDLKFTGMWHVAHELAHNLGAPHDGEGTASSCPWKDGYIMSYEGWGTTNKFKFSPCSAKLMKEYITSSGGKCMTEVHNQLPVVPLSNDWPGDKLNLDQYCKHQTKTPTAFADIVKSTGSENCKNLMCKYINPTNPNQVFTLKVGPALEGSPCGRDGRCKFGDCNGDKAANEKTTMETLCKSESGASNAYIDTTVTPSENCKNLHCKFQPASDPSNTYIGKFGPVKEGTNCGKGGQCVKERCLGDTSK